MDWEWTLVHVNLEKSLKSKACCFLNNDLISVHRFGRILRCDIPMPRSGSTSSRGLYAFVEFEDWRAAEDAYKYLHGKPFGEGIIKLQWARTVRKPAIDAPMMVDHRGRHPEMMMTERNTRSGDHQRDRNYSSREGERDHSNRGQPSWDPSSSRDRSRVYEESLPLPSAQQQQSLHQMDPKFGEASDRYRRDIRAPSRSPVRRNDNPRWDDDTSMRNAIPSHALRK